MTDGAFCVSSVLTQLSAYVDANFTVSYLEGAINGTNSTALDLFTSIQPNFLCNGCLFGLVDVVEAAAPIVGTTPLDYLANYAGLQLPIPEGATLNDVMDQTCAYVPLAVDSTQLPPGVSVSIVNSTFPNAPADGEAIEDGTPTPSEPEAAPPADAPGGAPEATPAPGAPAAPADPSAAAPSVASAVSAAAPSLPAMDRRSLRVVQHLRRRESEGRVCMMEESV